MEARGHWAIHKLECRDMARKEARRLFPKISATPSTPEEEKAASFEGVGELSKMTKLLHLFRDEGNEAAKSYLTALGIESMITEDEGSEKEKKEFLARLQEALNFLHRHAAVDLEMALW